jgi:hypothetical protein
MAKLIVGKAPLTTIRHTDGSRANLNRGAIVPGSADPKDVKRLLKEDYLEVIEVADPEPDVEVDADSGDAKTEPTTIPEIEAVVGTDPEKAKAYLEAEMAKPKPRPQLVAKLEAVIDAAAGGAE